MNARIFGAAEAVSLGLLAKAVPEADLDAAVEAEVKPYLSCAPGAVASAKALTQTLGPRIDTAMIDHSIKQLVARWETDEAKAGIDAFFAKSPAPWADPS